MADATELWVCPECGTSLDVSDLGFYASVECPLCQHKDRVHTLIANFLIEGVLGIGGMSVVLRGRDIVLDRVVAIKLLNDTYKGEDARIVRFERECALMARVRHTNVVSIYSAGWENGQFYIAMEEVPGKNLEELLTDGFCMEENRAIELISEVALGLDAASQAGLLHRDMKPGNIILSESGQAKVLDFGLSLASTDADDEEMIWATPFYVPPETLRREPEDVRTDIYALGMTLRHLLTGNDQFSYQAQSADDLLYCKEHLQPICHEYKEISSDVGRLVDHMTAYLPQDRPENYIALLKEIGMTMEKTRKKQRVSDYLRSKSFTLRATTAFVSIVAGYFLATYGLEFIYQTKSNVSQELPSSHVDASRYETLCKLVEQKDWAGAYQASMLISRNASDPDLSAWASLYAWTLCYVYDELKNKMPEAKLQLHDQFEHLSENSNAILPLHEDLIYLKPLLGRGDTSSKIPDALILGHPMLDAMQLIYLADLFKKKSQDAQADDYLNQARELMEKCVDPFKSSFIALEHDNKKSRLPNADDLFADQNLDSSDNLAMTTKEIKIPESDKPKSSTNSNQQVASTETFQQMFERVQMETAIEDLSDAQISKNKVLLQICKACMAMVSLYERKTSQNNWGDLSQSECIERAQQLASKNLYSQEYKEFKCMALLLAGSYSEAQELNPYKDEKLSSEPFAVLMRHWLSVLG